MSQTTQIIASAQNQNRKALLETEAKTILKEYSIPVTKFALAKTPNQAAKEASQIGFPIVLKIVSPDIIHKTEAGAVIVNLKNSAEVEEGYTKIVENSRKYSPNAKIVGVLVQEMAPQSTEVIVATGNKP